MFPTNPSNRPPVPPPSIPTPPPPPIALFGGGAAPPPVAALAQLATDPLVLAAMSGLLTAGTPDTGSSTTKDTAEGGADKQAVQSEWKEFKTSEGRIFWHSSKTNKSTWDKPDDLKSDFERIVATSTPWREYPQGDGKSYWHNIETKHSEWEVPAAVRDIKEKLDKLNAENWKTKKLDGKSQAKLEFKAYLEKKCIGHLATWDSIGKLLQRDPKWKVFDGFLTPGERKHILNEYVAALNKKVREEKRAQKANARDALSEFLTQWRKGELPNQSALPMKPDASYDQLKALAQNEPWWNVLEARDRFDIFEEVAQQATSEALSKIPRQLTDELLQFFEDVLGEELLPDTPPEEVVAFLRSSFPHGHLGHVSDLAILNAWKRTLMDHFDNRKQELAKNLFRTERKARDDFRALLAACEEEGLIHAKTEWVDFLAGAVPKSCPLPEDWDASLSKPMLNCVIRAQLQVKDWNPDKGTKFSTKLPEWEEGAVLFPPTRICEDPRYLRLFLEGGSSGRELFEDYVYFLWDLYEEVRTPMKAALGDSMSSISRLANSNEKITVPLIRDTILADRAIALPPRTAQKINRLGVWNPLIAYVVKRWRKNPTSTVTSTDTNSGANPQVTGAANALEIRGNATPPSETKSAIAAESPPPKPAS